MLSKQGLNIIFNLEASQAHDVPVTVNADPCMIYCRAIKILRSPPVLRLHRSLRRSSTVRKTEIPVALLEFQSLFEQVTYLVTLEYGNLLFSHRDSTLH
jgi:hypothetical protein